MAAAKLARTNKHIAAHWLKSGARLIADFDGNLAYRDLGPKVSREGTRLQPSFGVGGDSFPLAQIFDRFDPLASPILSSPARSSLTSVLATTRARTGFSAN
jgi:hypothetical protein